MTFRNKKRPENPEGRNTVPAIPEAVKLRIRRAGALVMALVLFLGVAFGSMPEGILSGLFSGTTAQAAPTTKINGENKYSSSGDDIVVGGFERSSDEDIWFFTAAATGQTVFCLNSGASLHFSKDTYQYSTVKASEYSNSTAARAIKWYANHSGGYTMGIKDGSGYSFGTWTFTADEVHALIQAYVWGGSTVVDKVLKNYCKVYDGNASQTQVIAMVRSNLVNEITDTALTGYIYVYTLYNCGKGSSSTHQVLLGWDDDGITTTKKNEYTPLYGSGSVTISGEEVELTIKKIDSTSKNTIDEATFSLTMDGKTVTSSMVTVTHGSVSGSTFTTEDGYITIVYKGSSGGIITKDDFGPYWYVSYDAGEPIPSGYYKTYALAYAAMQADISSWKASQSTSSTTSHTWKATEISAPVGHKLSSSSKTVTTSGSQSKTMTFRNEPTYIGVTVNKTYDDKYETQVEAAGQRLRQRKSRSWAAWR